MDIGIVVATASEMMALMDTFAQTHWTQGVDGFTVRRFNIGGNYIHAVDCGAGEINAAAATQMLITGCRCRFIINFGVCGALMPGLNIAEPVIVKSVIHYDRDVSAVDNCAPEMYEPFRSIYLPVTAEVINAVMEETSICPVDCASGDKFIAGEEAKRAMYLKYGTEVCDMEAAGVLLTAHRAGVPVLIIKSVSDGSEGGGDEYWNNVDIAAKKCVDTLTKILDGGKLK